MKNKELTRRIMALAMAAALSVSVSPVVYATERADAQTIKEDNQPALTPKRAQRKQRVQQRKVPKPSIR